MVKLIPYLWCFDTIIRNSRLISGQKHPALAKTGNNACFAGIETYLEGQMCSGSRIKLHKHWEIFWMSFQKWDRMAMVGVVGVVGVVGELSMVEWLSSKCISSPPTSLLTPMQKVLNLAPILPTSFSSPSFLVVVSASIPLQGVNEKMVYPNPPQLN